MAATTTALKPRHIVGGGAEEVAQEFTRTAEARPGYVLLTMPDERSAKTYAEILRDVAQLLPAAFESVQQAKIEQVVEALSTAVVPVSSEALAEARMMAETRDEVLNSGQFLTAQQIAELAKYSKTNPSSQPTRWKQDGAIFAIRQKGIYYFPLFALNPEDNYRPYKAMAEILRILRSVSLSDWGIASWFISDSSYLDDRAPKDLLANDPERVTAAARDEASEVSHG